MSPTHVEADGSVLQSSLPETEGTAGDGVGQPEAVEAIAPIGTDVEAAVITCRPDGVLTLPSGWMDVK